MNPSPEVEIDHANGDKLDNRRANLRTCSPSLNKANRTKSRGETSRYKGVYFHRIARKWSARIQRDRVSHYLGLFESEEDAARAYDARAVELFGPFARVNFPAPPALDVLQSRQRTLNNP